MTAAIITAIISAVAAIAGGIASYSNTKKTIQANQEQYNDWKAYQSPQSQMERLGDAGLNPYAVGNINNSLSQPFQVGTNQGIAEGLSGLSQSLGNFSGNLGNYAVQKQNQALSKERIELERQKVQMQLDMLDLRKEMMRTNINKGNAYGALLWSQGDISKLNAQFWRDTMAYRVGSAEYNYKSAKQAYEFNEKMNPLKLEFYPQYQRAMINELFARARHLSWYENFALQQLYQQDRHWRENRSDKYYFFGNDYGLKKDQLNLSQDYFDLRRSQFHWNILKDLIGLTGAGKLRGVTRKSAGGYPDYTEYDY